MGVCELYSDMLWSFKSPGRGRWDGVLPRANNNFRDGTRLGNGYVWRDNEIDHKPMKTLSRVIHTPRRRRIYLPQARWENRETGLILPTFLSHAPRAHDDLRGNQKINRLAVRRGLALANKFGRSLTFGDNNDGDFWKTHAAAGAKVRHTDVMYLAVYGDADLRDVEIHRDGVVGVWSDHGVVVGDVWI